MCKQTKNKPDNIGQRLGQNTGNPRKIPESMKKKQAAAYNQNQLSIERTALSELRTELAFTNSHLAADRTHLAYLRTVVSLIGSGATIYKALPLLGVSRHFTGFLTGFLLLSAVYFIYKDATTYPKLKQRLNEMEQAADDLITNTQDNIYRLDEDI